MVDNQKSPDQCWSGLFDVFPFGYYLKYAESIQTTFSFAVM